MNKGLQLRVMAVTTILINILTTLQGISKEAIHTNSTLKATVMPNPVDPLTDRGIQEDLNFSTNQETTGICS